MTKLQKVTRESGLSLIESLIGAAVFTIIAGAFAGFMGKHFSLSHDRHGVSMRDSLVFRIEDAILVDGPSLIRHSLPNCPDLANCVAGSCGSAWLQSCTFVNAQGTAVAGSAAAPVYYDASLNPLGSSAGARYQVVGQFAQSGSNINLSYILTTISAPGQPSSVAPNLQGAVGSYPAAQFVATGFCAAGTVLTGFTQTGAPTCVAPYPVQPTCPAGQYVINDNSDGTLVCTAIQNTIW